MKLNSVLDLHIHYVLPSEDVGKKIKFQLDVIAAGIHGTWAVPTGSPFTREHTIIAGEATKHNLLDICDIPAVNTTVSSIYTCELTRIAVSSDEYSGEVYVKYIDCHYEKDSLGSASETSK